MITRCAILLFGMAMALSLGAQPLFEKVYAPGSTTSMLMGPDSAIYQFGGYYDPAGAAVYVIKSRQNGQTIWQKQFPITSWGQSASVQAAAFDPNGNIRMLVLIAAGTPSCFGLMRIDTAGASVSLDRYLTPSGFLATGMTRGTDGSTYVVSSTFTMIKIAPAGNVVWSKDHLADGSIFSNTEHDNVGDILLTSSGQLLVNSTSWRDSDQFPPTAQLRQTIHRVDTAGAIVQSWSWRDTLSLYTFDSPGRLVEIPGGGMYVTGLASGSGQVPFAMRLDAGFAPQWAKVIRPPGCGASWLPQVAVGMNGGLVMGYRGCADDDGLTRLSSTGAHLGSRRLHFTTLPAHVGGVIPTADGGVTCGGYRHYLFAMDQPYLLHLDSALNTPCLSGVITPLIYTLDPAAQPPIPYTMVNVTGITHVPSTVTPLAVTQEYPTCTNQVSLSPKLWLEGPYNPAASMMKDSLRVSGLIPTAEPYTGLGFVNAGGGGGETTTPSVLATTGANAICDWVRLELRSASAPNVVVATRHCLVQRDGDVVSATNGLPTVTMSAPPGSYHLVVRHRNHLGVMTAAPVVLSGTPAVIDFRSSATATWGTNACKNINGAMALWAGNTVRDNPAPFRLKYTGATNDRDAVLTAIGGLVPTNTAFGYLVADVNMDCWVKYVGANNDRDIILLNIGGVVPTYTRVEQVP